MFARLSAKVLLLAAAVALVFFGIGLLGLALATALVTHFGTVGAYALTGAVMLMLALLAVGLMALSKPHRPPPPPPGAFLAMLLGGLARDVPWAAVLSAGAAAIAEMLLKRKKPQTRD